MTQFNDRNFRQPQLACSRQTTVPGDHAADTVDQHRICPAKLSDAGGDLNHLLLAVGARVAGERDQRVNLAVLDVEGIHGFDVSKKMRPARVYKNQ